MNTESEFNIKSVRVRILEAASKLIAEGGIDALTTRSVAAAAAVQPPILYRLFGEKRGLLNAVAEHGLAEFVAQKIALPPDPDPVQNLKNAWDSYVAFGLANPAVFAIMNQVGAPIAESPATLAGLKVLRERVDRVARSGRLQVPVERAVALIHAVGVGTVTALLAVPQGERDAQLSPMARDAILALITRDSSVQDANDISSLAAGLRAHLDTAKGLTRGEHLLLTELLDRIS